MKTILTKHDKLKVLVQSAFVSSETEQKSLTVNSRAELWIRNLWKSESLFFFSLSCMASILSHPALDLSWVCASWAITPVLWVLNGLLSIYCHRPELFVSPIHEHMHSEFWSVSVYVGLICLLFVCVHVCVFLYFPYFPNNKDVYWRVKYPQFPKTSVISIII